MRRLNRLLSLVSFAAVVWSLWRVGTALSLMFAMSTHTALLSPLWYAASVLMVLVAHEGGHLAAAWWVGLESGWPVFFPWPLQAAAWLGWPWLPAFGTLGAWLPISGLRRRSGADQWPVAMAGLLAGLVVSLTLVGLGAVLSVPGPEVKVWSHLPEPWVLRWLVPDHLLWHPVLMAGWLGLTLTWLNCLPIPGLDGWKLWAFWDDYSTAQKWGSVILGGGLGCACLPGF